MAEQTGIAWCDHTQNFWFGCTKISAACDFCYAEELMDHRYGRVEWGGPRVRTSAQNWRKPYRWNKAAKADGVRRKVFTLSLGDFADNQVDPVWRTEAWKVIEDCPDLDWLILSKRPQNYQKMLPASGPEWPWPHVWLGTTAENQEEWDRRVEVLGAVPAAVHFVSVEPMLESIDVGNAFDYPPDGSPYTPIKWIICGGESGSKARPFAARWARDLLMQCQIGVRPAFFMKQFGSNPVGVSGITGKGDDPAEWPADLRVREFPA